MSKSTPVPLALVVSTKQDGGYFHVYADPAIVKVPHTTYEWPSSYERQNSLDLNNLRATSQGNDRTHDGDTAQRDLYGWEIRYEHRGYIDLRDVEGMARTLRSVTKRMEDLSQKYGRPSTYGQYVARFAAALRASWIIVRERQGPSERQFGEPRWYSVGDGIDAIDYVVQRWIDEGRPCRHASTFADGEGRRCNDCRELLPEEAA